MNVSTGRPRRTRPSVPTPGMEDFRCAGEVLIAYQDEGADSFGRRQFFAFWIADNVGYGCDQTGVRAQVFFTRPDVFRDRQSKFGHTVREYRP